MKFYPALWLMILGISFLSCAQQKTQTYHQDLPSIIEDPSAYNKLSQEEAYVILNKGTERPFTGAYHNAKAPGTYICKQCNNPLFRSTDKFDSGTGWPSFDDALAKAVKEETDADGYRTEILCANCDGHLGHVFRGEGFTNKQTRHCVNSLSLDFVPIQMENPKPAKPKDTDVVPISEYIEGKGYENYQVATFAGGCFWCTEAAFERIEGVKDVISGYSGGQQAYPTYKEVGYGNTDHAEAIMIYFDPAVVDYATLLQVFFVAHDPTQLNRQGPDVGRQYRSAIFYHNDDQQALSAHLINTLNDSGKLEKKIVTELNSYEEFWVAEAYHQDYYELNPGNSYVRNVSRPKVEKVEKLFASILKEKYRKL